MIEPQSIVTCEDCMTLMARYPDKYFDLAIVDPPYRDEHKPTLWMERYADGSMENFGKRPSQEYFSALRRVSRFQIVWGANNFGMEFQGFVVWDKQIRGSCRYSWVEIAAVSEELSTVGLMFSCPVDNDRIHPTQKPVKLYDWLLGNYAEGCKTILDTHLGSGSSRIAAHKAGFDFVGCEIDKDYFAAQEKRFQDYLKQMKLQFSPLGDRLKG